MVFYVNLDGLDGTKRLANEKAMVKTAIRDDYNKHRNIQNYYYEMERKICEFYFDAVDEVKTYVELIGLLNDYVKAKYANHLVYYKSLFSRNGGMQLDTSFSLIIKYKIDVIETQTLMDVEELMFRLFKEIAKQDRNKGFEFLAFSNTVSLLKDLETREIDLDRVDLLKKLAFNLRTFIATKDVISWDEIIKIMEILDVTIDMFIKNNINAICDLFNGIQFDKTNGFLEKIEQRLSRRKPEM